MKNLVHLLIAALVALACSSCTSTPTAATSQETTIANVVGDVLSVGLAPVLAHNPDYAPAVAALGVALGTFTGDTLTADNVQALVGAVAKQYPEFTATDQATVSALINTAWARYAKNYQATVSSSVRPDVKLFMSAAADGIAAAVAAANATQTAK